MNRYLFLACFLIAGCAEVQKPVTRMAPQPVQPAVQAPEQTPAPEVLPDIELTQDLLYEILLSEFAAQRGHMGLALDESLDLAQRTRDPRLARRAAQLALESKDMKKSVEAVGLWHELDPGSSMATRMLSSLLLRGGRLEEARPYLVEVLKGDGDNVGLTFLQLYPLTAPQQDKVATLKLMRDLAVPYPDVSEAHWVVAELARAAGDDKLALIEARLAHELKPAWNAPVSLEAELLSRSSPEQSLELMRGYLADYPGASEVRLQYARELLAQKQYQAARDEFQRLARENPDNVELAFAVALISLQLNDFPEAENQLKNTLVRDGKTQDDVAYFLGQLYEAKEDGAKALEYYRKVNAGEYRYAAQLRSVYLLSRENKLDEARQVLHQAAVDNSEKRPELWVIEAQLLRDAKQPDAALEVLQHGLEKLPDDTGLLYEAAMQADQLGRFEESEKWLRHLIKVRPDFAHAYNALGYGFLERKVRIPEATELVEKALKLAPDDHAIMDSVGWAYYLGGNFDASVAMLKKAYSGTGDPEIAAHLGEALWARGDKEEAEKLMQDSLKAHPDSEPLKSAIKRFAK
jgi:tetratricopeptide (TPR) repeat protein